MQQQHATQDPEARKEIQNLYKHLTLLSELVTEQQKTIENLEEELEQLPDKMEGKFLTSSDLEEQIAEVRTQMQQMDVEEDSDKYTCPECGDQFETIGSMSSHIGRSQDHKSVLDYFRVGSGYYNPITEEVYTKSNFGNSWSDLDLSPTEFLLLNFDNIDQLVKNASEDYECYQCGKSFDTLNSLQLHTSNSKDHRNPADYFKVNGKYVNPVNEVEYADYEKFKSSWHNLDSNISQYYFENFGDLPAQ